MDGGLLRKEKSPFDNYSGLRLIEEAACLRARYCTATMRERSLRSSENRCSPYSVEPGRIV
jgi:hypothetical protein